MQLADYLILLFYGSGILGISFFLSRRIKDSSDMFAAGGQSPWWVSGLSSFMTMFSAGTFVVWGGIAYRLGMVAVSISLCYGLAAFLVGWTLAARWREIGVSSAAEFLQLRYGNSIVQFYTWLQGILQIFTLGGSIYALALVICTLIPLPMGIEDTVFGFLRDDLTGHLSVLWVSVIVLSAVIVVTLTGGLWAVLMTDTLQFIVLTASVVFVVPLIISEAGGLGTFIGNAADTPVDAAGNNLLSPIAGNYSWWFLIGWLIVHYAKIGGEWAFVQRFNCVSSPRDARKSAYLFGVMYLVSPLFWMLPAIAFRTIHPIPEGLDTELLAYVNSVDFDALAQTTQAHLTAGNWQQVPTEVIEPLRDSAIKRFSERSYILACQAVLPPGMIGLMVAAMISATASMATTQLNVYAGAFTEQVYQRFFNRRADERKCVRAGRFATFLLGLLALAGSFVIPRAGTYEDYVIALSAALTIPLVLPTIWGLFSKRVGLAGAWTTTCVGVSTSLFVKFGFQGSDSWFAGVGWAQGLVSLASRNTAVTDWVIGLTVPILILVLFHILSPKTSSGWHAVEASRTKQETLPPPKPSTLPARIVGYSILLLGIAFAALIPQADETLVLGSFAALMAGLGIATLAWTRQFEKKLRAAE